MATQKYLWHARRGYCDTDYVAITVTVLGEARRMTLLARIRHQCNSAKVVGVLLLAWGGILVTPCAAAFATAAPSPELLASPHDHCPGANAQTPMTASDCCCDPSVVLTVEKLELPKPNAQLVLAVEPNLLNPVLPSEGAPRHQTILRYDTSPPIYLTTQRLRI